MVKRSLTTAETRWVLTSGAFEKLLSYLDPDREKAGQKYQSLRRRLVTVLAFRGSLSPEDDADESLNRVCRRLAEGEQIVNLYGYCAAVARLVSVERARTIARQHRSLADFAAISVPSDPASNDADRVASLDRCLASLSTVSRELVLEYYQGRWEERISTRKKMAARLGIAPGVLRIRVHRIREKLEHCVKNCLDRRDMKDAGRAGARQ